MAVAAATTTTTTTTGEDDDDNGPRRLAIKMRIFCLGCMREEGAPHYKKIGDVKTSQREFLMF